MTLGTTPRDTRPSATGRGAEGRRHSTAISRRTLLASVSLLTLGVGHSVLARIYQGGALPWNPSDTDPPNPVRPGPWLYFTAQEAAAVEAIVDRLIPPDATGPSGKSAGCAVFIDRQLAGAFGDSRRLYMRPPFAKGTPSQGPQSPIVPKELYRISLAGLSEHCRTAFAGKEFTTLTETQQDQILGDLENGKIEFKAGNGNVFFDRILADTIAGYFADPVYGGNRDMEGWKMIGFPGARYDYRDHVAKHNQPYPLPPVSILGRSGWSVPG
jgi:gluconate 2-dehydrogenase gamma chain